MILVKYSCGCIGIPFGKDAILVKACDDETGEFMMRRRCMDKPYESLSEDDALKVFKKID